ncbi:aminopeptidase N [soil metagenome]|jgi:aminopeptidase N
MSTADNLTRDQAFTRSSLLSVRSYDVHLDLTGDGETFVSTTVVRFGCVQPGASTFIDLDARGVRAARLNGRELAPETFGGFRLALDDLSADNQLEVVADCAYQTTGVGLHRFTDPVDGAVYCYTQFEPFDAHRMFACFDQPNLKATFTFSVAAPEKWVVISCAEAVQQPEEGEAGLWRFATTPPLSTYVTAVVAGPYQQVAQRHGDIELRLLCRRSLMAHLEADEIFTITGQGFDFYTATFDHPYPFDKYDQVFVPEFNAGAMENAACVTFSESYLFRSKVTAANRRRRAETILHELAHMWFGDLVTMRWWDDLWLNESFATYMAFQAMASATDFEGAWADFAYDMKSWAYNQDQLPSTHPVVADMVDTDSVRNNFDGITYAKGAAVLRQLVAWVGEEAFVKGLRGYFPRHAWGNAELSDFLDALEQASGRDLRVWAKQWLQTSGVMTLRVTGETVDGRYGEIALRQAAAQDHPTLPSHRVGLGLYDLDGGRLVLRRRVEVDAEGARTAVGGMAGERLADLLLPNDGDLAYAKVRLDERSVNTITAHLGVLSDPLSQALCWQAAWDMTRDGELAARRWVALVVRHAAQESDVGVLTQLLAQTAAAIDRYGDPDNRARARRQVADLGRSEFEGAEPGSDRQLIWVRAFAAAAATGEQLAVVRGLLDSSFQVVGLAVDTDLRWYLLMVLAAAGEATDDDVTEELRRDPTDMGRRKAASVRTAMPTAQAKAQAWAALTQRPAPPLATMRALVAGFWQRGQLELLRPYVERYLEVLPGAWSQRDAEEALLLTEGLYPGIFVEQATVGVADRALASPALPPPGRRLVTEARDATQRALRAQRTDAAER